jgi:hypothetical protein
MSEFREAMNIAETARLIRMSRSRFNQLLGTVFPSPKRDEHGRPYFDREQQMQIVEIRRTNKGMDGKPMLFRATGSRTSLPAKPKGKPVSAPKQDHTELLKAVRGLGLERTTHKDIEKCLATLYPNGQLPADQGTLIREVFLSIKTRFSPDSEER